MIRKLTFSSCLINIFILFFSAYLFSQNTTSNYFDILQEKQLELDIESKKTPYKDTDTTLLKNRKKLARWQWFWHSRIDKNGSLNAYNKELFASDKIDQLRTHNIFKEKNTSWQIIGPEKYPLGTNPSGVKGIGRIDAIIVNPNNKNHVIIGAKAGGVWETYNSNDSIPYWKCLTNNLPVYSVNDLKIVNNTLYAATSNINSTLSQGDTRYGLGIIKKKLHDSVWQLPNKVFECIKMTVSNNNTNIMYATGEKHIYKSEDSGNNWKKLSEPIKDIDNSKILITNIEINPYDDDKILISGRLYTYNKTNHKEKDILIFKSDNGGKSWTNLTSDLEKFINTKIEDVKAKDKLISLTKGLKNHISTYTFQEKTYLCVQQMYRPNHVYFVTLNNKWDKFQLFNSLSKNNTFYYTTDNVDACFQVINENEILIGNRRLRLINNQKHTITGLDDRYKYLHQDIRAINYDLNLGRLLIGTDGGINIGFDIKNNLNFSRLNNASGNLNLFLAFNMSYINKNSTRTVRIGNQDTGYYKSDNTNGSWTQWTRFGSFGEGLVYTDPIDPKIVYRINAGGHGGNIQKSIDTGKRFRNTKTKASNYVFSPLEIDEQNTNNLIFDSFKKTDQYALSLSNDQMKTIVDISNGIEQLDKGMNLSLAISCKNPAVFYVARKSFHLDKYGINNSLYKSENFNFNTPNKIKYINLTDNITKLDSTILKSAFITHIEVNNSNENELWVSFGNLENRKKIYHSIDGGYNWANISNNLPNVPLNTVKYDAINKTLYAGNDYGVYYYNMVSKQWNKYGSGLPISIVMSIEIDTMEKELIVATHGRSVWTAPLIKKNNHIISSDTLWTSDKIIDGDLVVKEGVTLIINNATIKTNNITIENNGRINCFSSKLVSNHKNSMSNYFNTTILAKPNSSITIANTEINNYTIDLKSNSSLTLYGTNDITLNHTTINIFEDAKYLQDKKTNLILKDINTNILFHGNQQLGATPYLSKIDKLKFDGNGSIKVLNKKH